MTLKVTQRGVAPRIRTLPPHIPIGNVGGLKDSTFLRGYCDIRVRKGSDWLVDIWLTKCILAYGKVFLGEAGLILDTYCVRYPHAMQATKFGSNDRAVTILFLYLLNKVNNPSLPYLHYFFLTFFYCSCLISVLVSLQNYSSLFAVRSLP